MKKIIFLTITLIICIQAYSQDVSVILHAPGSASQGQEFEISLTVNKADVTGFARLQLDLPSGFTVKAGNTQGSTFSFKDNKVRFLWMSLPADRTMKVSCLATADNTVGGSVNIAGAFSYVLNNETQRFAIPEQVIQFGAAAMASNDDAQKEAERLEKERQEKLKKEKEEHDRLEREKAEKEAREEAERLAAAYVPAQTDDTETTPEVRTETQELSNTPDVIETPVTTTTSETTASNEPAPVVTESVTEPEPVKVPVVETPAYTPPANETPVYTPTTTRKSGTSVEFKVQIGAFKSSPDKTYFRKLENNITEFKVNKSNDNDGYIRYFIGSFDNFNAVNSFHQSVMGLGYQSFIVAHKDGRKITINEAKQLTGN